MVGRQIERRQVSVKLLPPILPEAFAGFPRQHGLLPSDKVSIGTRQFRQRDRLGGAIRGIKRSKFVHERHERPHVYADMMRREQEEVIICGATQQQQPQRRPAFQIKGAIGVFGERGLNALLVPRRGITICEWQVEMRQNLLLRHAVL